MLLLAVRNMPLMLLLTGLACADESKIVDFSLSTTGTFSSSVDRDVAFHGYQGFTGATSPDGFLMLGDLGTFTLTRPAKGADVYNSKSDTFTLDLAFSSPTGIQGPTVFDASIKGEVNRKQGSVFIDFGPAQTFKFSTPSVSGSFDLTIDDVTLDLRNGAGVVSDILTGQITNANDPPAPLPEPQSIALLITALMLTAYGCRRIRRA